MDGEEGVLVAQGGNTGGFSLFVKDHRLHYTHNYVGSQQFHLSSDAALSPGKHELRYEFEPSGKPDLAQGKGSPGKAQLYVDGKLAGQLQLPVTMPMSMGLGEGLSVGRDEGSAVSSEYAPPFAFNGTLRTITVDVSGKLIEDTEAQVRQVMARQ
jgi:arylsulfatase